MNPYQPPGPYQQGPQQPGHAPYGQPPPYGQPGQFSPGYPQAPYSSRPPQRGKGTAMTSAILAMLMGLFMGLVGVTAITAIGAVGGIEGESSVGLSLAIAISALVGGIGLVLGAVTMLVRKGFAPFVILAGVVGTLLSHVFAFSDSGLSEGMAMIGDFILIAITLAIGVLALLPGSQAYAKKQP